MHRSNFKIFRDYSLTILLAVFLAFLIRTYGIEAYRIPSAAMKPTLVPGDIIFVSKWPFQVSKNFEPKRGDVVVFEESQSSGSDYIKRIIGLPGDEIMIRKGELILNGKRLIRNPSTTPYCPEEYLPEGKHYPICIENPLLDNFGPKKVPPNSLFVLGDLRSEILVSKQDSTNAPSKKKGWGIIPSSSLKGKALWVWLSIEPERDLGTNSDWFSRLRTHRMFREVQ